MPNEFKCNMTTGDNPPSQSEKISSFNAVYDYYYDKVIRNPGNADLAFNPPNDFKTHCSIQGCPSNFNAESIVQNKFFREVIGHNDIAVKNKDLARYLNDCASNMALDKGTSDYDYGGDSNFYKKTTRLRDEKYNLLLTDRSDLDRKMKEVLALQGAMVNEHQNYVDGSVYTTLLWTVMATSLIYYVFTKI